MTWGHTISPPRGAGFTNPGKVAISTLYRAVSTCGAGMFVPGLLQL